MKNFKSPEVKVPAALRDLYQDLRDRRLLPLVALLVVAIAAVPFLLSDPTEPEAPPVGAGGGATGSAANTALTVVPAAPGVRDPRRRLDHREPQDPFIQKFKGQGLSEESVDVESGSEPEGGGGTPAGEGPPTTVDPGDSRLYYYTTAVKVKVVKSMPDPEGGVVRDEVVLPQVLPATTLMGEKQQVVTYMGLSPKTKQPAFLVSDDVTGVFGEGKCLAGTESCQLIELRVNQPQVFLYRENGVRFRINVLDIDLVKKGQI
jgi:hypothetical protein